MRWGAPWAFLALALLPILIWRGRRIVARHAAVLWVRVESAWAARLAALPLRAVAALPWLALAVALLALARPLEGLRRSETETRGVDIVLAMDVSPSMRAEDFRPRNRLFVAKETAREFVRQRAHDRVGLVAFGASAFTQCPLTLDHAVLDLLISALDFGMVEDGTAVGMGLATAVARLKESKTPSKVVVLLTDGQSNRGAIDPITAAELARALGIRVYTVLVGRGGMVPVPSNDPTAGQQIDMVRMDVDEGTMREIARLTGGRFYRAVDPGALSAIYSSIDRLERAPIKSIEYREYLDLGPLFLGIAAVLLLIHGLCSATWAYRLP